MSLTKRQLEARKSMITGTEASVIEECSPYNSLYNLWAVKTGRITDTVVPNIAMKVGHALEQLCVDEYEAKFNVKCRQVHRTIRMKASQIGWSGAMFIGGHPDRIIAGNRNKGLECKTVTINGESNWDEGVPVWYISQVKHYALCTGRLEWDFSVIFTTRGKVEFYTHKFSRQDLDEYLEKCIAFWKLVESDTPPEVDSSKATGQALRKQWQETDIGSIKVVTKGVLQYFTNRFQHKHFRDIAQDQMDLAENRIVKFMQEKETLVAPGGETIFTLKTDKNGKRRKNFNYNIERDSAQGSEDDNAIAV